jgi:hypothetical protein
VDTAEATAKPVRRRTRKAVAETVEAAIPAQSAAVDEPEAKPRRRTRKAAAAAEPAES